MARYCPAGDGAFEDWVRACPECGRTLRSTPPADTDALPANDEPIVWVATAANEVEASMWAGSLRKESIPVLVRPGGPGAGAWASSATFEHNLYVREQDVTQARAVLEAGISGLPSRIRARRAAPRVHPRSLRRAG